MLPAHGRGRLLQWVPRSPSVSSSRPHRLPPIAKKEPSTLAVQAAPPATSVLVTMDPGQDLDDEMFLVLLATLTRRRLVRCVGVVATLAPAAMRAQLARGTLDELGLRDVPVGAGSDGGATGKRDFSDVTYLHPPRSGLDGDHIMHEALASAGDRSVTLIVVASLKDVAGLLRREEALFVRKVKEVVIQGGVKPFESGLLEPDTAHNNEFDHDASAFFYRRCQELKVPLVIVSRFTANACQMPRRIYDDMAATGSPIGIHLQKSQATSIEQLWRRVNATGERREGLPARCDGEWFCNTFCAGKGKERDGSQAIWDLIVGFNVYDPIALVAAVPSLSAQFFDFEEVVVGGVVHRIAGTSKERTGLKTDASLQRMLVDAFLHGVEPQDTDARVERMREELAAEKAERLRLQQRLDELERLGISSAALSAQKAGGQYVLCLPLGAPA